jgi:hypothetical protein
LMDFQDDLHLCCKGDAVETVQIPTV